MPVTDEMLETVATAIEASDPVGLSPAHPAYTDMARAALAAAYPLVVAECAAVPGDAAKRLRKRMEDYAPADWHPDEGAASQFEAIEHLILALAHQSD